MSLSRHIDPDELLQSCREHPHHNLIKRENKAESRGNYSSRYTIQPLPKYRLPSQGVGAETAYQLIHDELQLDGTPILNLASFVNTQMPHEADKLMTENLAKNLIDEDEYKATVMIHHRCVSMLAHLWKIPKGNKAIGTATTGSSEAIMLGGLALKRRWIAKRKAEGKDTSNPNIIMGANAQVALEKFARYFEVEPRLVPVSAESHYCMSPKDAIKYVDENTIGIFVILGSTYTGHYENVLEMSELLDEYQESTGVDIPIHVDAASGGFVAPFAHPDLKWSFDVPRVVSINASGHKFGMTYVGVGWVVWRGEEYLPKELIFELHYLGSTEYTYSLNFSRPAAPIIAQYFNFLNLGIEGYRMITMADLENARLVSHALERSKYFEVLSDIHRPRRNVSKDVADDDPRRYVEGLPVVAFKFTEDFKTAHPNIQQKWVQTLLRVRGWIVPNYGLPKNLDNVDILRVIVRENLSEDMVERLIVDICEVVDELIDYEGEGHNILNGPTARKGGTRAEKHEHQHSSMRDQGKKGERRVETYSRPC